MLILKIIINENIYELLSKLIIDYYYLINIFKDGICITQNINKLSNLSIFIPKKHLDVHDVIYEKSLVCESFEILKNFEIIYENNEFKLNGKAKIVNDYCNTCKLLKDIDFANNEITFDQLNLSKNLSQLKDNKFKIHVSDKFNGVLLKTDYHNFNIYVNIIGK